MDLTLDAEQEMLTAAVRAFLADRWSLAATRTVERDGGFDRARWREMAGLGWMGLELSPDVGGSGRSFLDTVLVAEELGRALLPSPFVPTVAMAAPVLDGARQRALAAGELVATVAVAEPGWRGLRGHPTLALVDGRLSGRKCFVPFAAEADVLVVAVRGPALAVVTRGAPRLAWTAHRPLGGDPLYEVTFDHTPAELLDPPGDPGRLLDRGAVATLVHLAGAAERALAMTVEHARTREQFGRPIGSFQAVAHRCVDMRSRLDALTVLVRQAAWMIATGRPADVEIGSALAYGLDALRRFYADAHQVHGAIGFSMEHDLQLFTRRAKAAECLWGPPAWHRERVARGMGL
jgi:alkylation response protein AidB-like acyl-CoA dehydrogenase